MIKAIILFLAAGLAEIGGGYLVWLLAEGIQTDMGRRAGRDNPGALRDHSHHAKFPEFWPRLRRLWRDFYCFGRFLGMVRGQENA